MNVLQITIPLIFAVAAVVSCFFRRFPACLIAYASFVSAGLLGVIHFPVSQYLIWGFLSLIDTVNIYATRMTPSRPMQLYTVVGCLVGCVVGWLMGSIITFMVVGAVGAALGFLAFMRTPQGRAVKLPMSHLLSLFAGAACTAWFSMCMVAVVLEAIFVRSSAL